MSSVTVDVRRRFSMSLSSLLGRQAQDGSAPWWDLPVFTTRHSSITSCSSWLVNKPESLLGVTFGGVGGLFPIRVVCGLLMLVAPTVFKSILLPYIS